MQLKGVKSGESYGYLSVKDIAQRLGLDTKWVRSLVADLVETKQIGRVDFINGVFYRSLNPLPWEPGYKPEVKRREVTIEKCQCGHPTCKRYGLSLGTFYQGTGFSEAQAMRIAELINNDPKFPLEE